MTTALPLSGVIARVALVGCALMAAIVLSSAYLRLATLGVGCVEWPQCYGRIPPRDDVAQAAPSQPAGSAVAWVRIVHRVAAMAIAILAVLVLILAVHPGGRSRVNVALAIAIVVLTLVLSIIGRWSAGTLVPAIGVANLAGGFAMLVCFWLLYLHNRVTIGAVEIAGLARVLHLAAIVFAGMQIALGAWVSVSYSAPLCRGVFDCERPALDGAHATSPQLLSALAADDQGRVAPAQGAPVLQKLHRVSGVVLALVLTALAALRMRDARSRAQGAWLLALAIVVPAFGIALTLFEFPRLAALAHNALAAVLLLVLVSMPYATRTPSPSG